MNGNVLVSTRGSQRGTRLRLAGNTKQRAEGCCSLLLLALVMGAPSDLEQLYGGRS